MVGRWRKFLSYCTGVQEFSAQSILHFPLILEYREKTDHLCQVGKFYMVMAVYALLTGIVVLV